MSAAFDHATAHAPSTADAQPPRRLAVAPVLASEEVAADPAALDGDELALAEARIADLQRHLANLARRYADDAATFGKRLQRAQHEIDVARADARRANQRAAAAQAETFRLRGDCGFLSERLTNQRIRNGQLEEAAALPWWAVARRRMALRELGLSQR